METSLLAVRARTDVGEILRTPVPRFNAREMMLLHAVCIPDHKSHKEMTHDAGMTESVGKVYYSKLYRKLGWRNGSTKMLVLWAIAHRQMLGIELPTPDQFPYSPSIPQ